MALIQESYLRNLAAQRVRNDSRYSAHSNEAAHDSIRKSLLLESDVVFSAGKQSFDIFLSHSYSDKELILGIKICFENFGYSVYVDWIEDYSMDRTNVTKANAFWIKKRMRTSRCLLYATSSNSSSSKWMPWELGFMDGFKDKVAILPISRTDQVSYKGNEYLGIYPYMEMEGAQGSDGLFLWVTDQANHNNSTKFDDWLNDGKLTLHSG
jgi:hypothetical protein